MKKRHYPKLILLAGCMFTIMFTSAQVVINEFSCSNLSQFVDNNSEYEDWIELYNTAASPVNLAGYYLSDDSVNTAKWKIPGGVTIGANGFLRFWTSGRNLVAGAHYHTNFKLHQTKNKAEFIVLSDPSALILDYVKLNNSNKTQLGHSRGRSPDGAAVWSVFTLPTPNASNNASISYVGYAAKPSFDTLAGFYPGPIMVNIINNEPNSTVYYTLDGTLPTVASPVYSAPINISATKVLKAFSKSTNPQILSSFLEFSTFFINESPTMSVISISATQLTNLANGSGTLRPHGSFEYFDVNGNRKSKTYGEFNRHGQDSWVLSQRSLDFIARDEMGYNYTVKGQLFPQAKRDSYQRLILRAAGDDNFPADYRSANAGSAHVRDAYIHMLAANGGMSLDVRRAVKTLVFINGLYWGVYDIRDNPDDHDHTNFYYGQDKFHLQFLETWGTTWAEYGGSQALADWSSLRSYILGNSMQVQANFDYVTSQLDVASLADYVLVNSFTVCTDWLNYNTGWWRGMDTTGTHRKWGYILWDNDATFRFYINYTNVPSTQFNAPICNPQTLSSNYNDPQQHLQILKKLMTNPEFNTWYINRAIDLWNTVFSCQNMLHQLDSIVMVLTPEMPRHCTRWNGQLNDWQNNVQTLRTFISNRCNYLTTGFKNCYSLTGPYEVVLNTDPPNSGTIKLNSLTLSHFPWTGTYYGNITTSLKAITNTSLPFDQWSTLAQALNPGVTNPDVSLNLVSSDSITAHFGVITSIGNYPGIGTGVSVYPTVFNKETTIEYTLPNEAPVTIRLMTLLGKEVANIKSPSDFVGRGNYSVKMDLSGNNLSAGIYLLNFTAGDFSKTIKLIYSPE